MAKSLSNIQGHYAQKYSEFQAVLEQKCPTAILRCKSTARELVFFVPAEPTDWAFLKMTDMREELSKTFEYEGNQITFDTGNGVIVNATQMAKAFGKRTNDWLSTKSAQEFIHVLSSEAGIPVSQLVVVNKGNSSRFDQGTWLHEDVALEFARWLSPKFAIWCNDRIKELLYGEKPSQYVPSYQIEDPIARAEKWIAEQREAQRALIEKDVTISQQQRQLESQAPKVVFADAVTASDKSILVSELAKILTQNGFPIGQNRLYELLRRDGYLCHRGACYNQPTQRAMELGLFELKQTAITKPNGSIQTVITTKVSGKGSVYFINHYLPHRVIAQNFKNQKSNAIPNC